MQNLLRLRLGLCTYSWTFRVNSNVHNGRAAAGVSTVRHCQAVCINDALCTGVDWAPSYPVDQKCWKHGSHSGQPGTIAGVTHYDVVRNCPSKTHFCICSPLSPYFFYKIAVLSLRFVCTTFAARGGCLQLA